MRPGLLVMLVALALAPVSELALRPVHSQTAKPIANP